MGGWGWGAGSSGNKATSAQLSWAWAELGNILSRAVVEGGSVDSSGPSDRSWLITVVVIVAFGNKALGEKHIWVLDNS